MKFLFVKEMWLGFNGGFGFMLRLICAIQAFFYLLC